MIGRWWLIRALLLQIKSFLLSDYLQSALAILLINCDGCQRSITWFFQRYCARLKIYFHRFIVGVRVQTLRFQAFDGHLVVLWVVDVIKRSCGSRHGSVRVVLHSFKVFLWWYVSLVEEWASIGCFLLFESDFWLIHILILLPTE